MMMIAIVLWCLKSLFPFNCFNDDVEFINCLYNLRIGNSLNATIIQNTAQFKITNKFSLINNDIDPDKIVCVCGISTAGDRCYLSDYFNSIHSDNTRFSILHLNARFEYKF